MSDIFEEVCRLDDAGQHQEIINTLLRHSTDPDTLVSVVRQLLKLERFAGAAYVGSALVRVGVDDAIAHLGRAIGGIMRNDIELQRDSGAALARLFDAMTPALQVSFFTDTFNPVLFYFVNEASRTNDQAAYLRVLELYKAGAPVLRRVFDWSAEAADLIDGGDPGSLVSYRSPPAGSKSGSYRTVVAMRERMFPYDPQSRLLDIGPRFADAAERYGWVASFCPLKFNVQLDFPAMIEHCRTVAAEILIFDDHLVMNEATHAYRSHMIGLLRQACPSIKIVPVYFDSWEIKPEFLIRAVAEVDAVWATTPAMPHWADRAFEGKLMQAPLPHAANSIPPNDAAPNRISFVGAMAIYNWHRAFWRAAAMRDGLAIDWQLTFHRTDGLPPLDSYAAYMRRLAESGCAVNFAMRPDLTCVVTDRTFESLLAGTLLIQERAADIDHFFVAGQHYLPFSSYADLKAVVDIVATRPDVIQSIRHAGHEFAVARYADHKLIGYLDAILFHPEAAKPTT